MIRILLRTHEYYNLTEMVKLMEMPRKKQMVNKMRLIMVKRHKMQMIMVRSMKQEIMIRFLIKKTMEMLITQRMMRRPMVMIMIKRMKMEMLMGMVKEMRTKMGIRGHVQMGLLREMSNVMMVTK